MLYSNMYLVTLLKEDTMQWKNNNDIVQFDS